MGGGKEMEIFNKKKMPLLGISLSELHCDSDYVYLQTTHVPMSDSEICNGFLLIILHA